MICLVKCQMTCKRFRFEKHISTSRHLLSNIVDHTQPQAQTKILLVADIKIII
jgi:hypothetical protein